MAFVGKLCDMRNILHTQALLGIYTYLSNACTKGSCEFERILSTSGEQKIQLDSGAFAIEQSYHLKDLSKAFYETHRKYVDLQLVVQGEEIFSIAVASDCVIKDTYDVQKDIATYHTPKRSSTLHLSAGMLAVFFPYDVHSGGLGAESLGIKPVYKSVVKVPVDLLTPRF